MGRKIFARAVVMSSVVSSPVGTIPCRYLAGFGVTCQAVLGQFIFKTVRALIAAGIITALVHWRVPEVAPEI